MYSIIERVTFFLIMVGRCSPSRSKIWFRFESKESYLLNYQFLPNTIYLIGSRRPLSFHHYYYHKTIPYRETVINYHPLIHSTSASLKSPSIPIFIYSPSTDNSSESIFTPHYLLTTNY